MNLRPDAHPVTLFNWPLNPHACLQRNEGCWWFGEEDQCATFAVLIGVVVVCAVTDLTCILLVVHGGWSSVKSRCVDAAVLPMRATYCCCPCVRRLPDHACTCACRSVLYMHAISMLCELGVVSATLLNLFSAIKSHAHSDGAVTEASYRAQIWITLSSLVSTIVAFLLTVVGAGSILAGMRKVLEVSRASLHGASRMHSTLTHKRTSFVAPMPPKMDDGAQEPVR
jgi:hypothetical protein